MKYKEINELTENEIISRIEEEKAKLVKLKINHAVSPVEDPSSMAKTRKTIARLKTALSARV
jgi:large subunit ribosomal protein L29